MCHSPRHFTYNKFQLHSFSLKLSPNIFFSLYTVKYLQLMYKTDI